MGQLRAALSYSYCFLVTTHPVDGDSRICAMALSVLVAYDDYVTRHSSHLVA